MADLFCCVVLTDNLWNDSDRTMAQEACQACPRYGRRWGCPPFLKKDMGCERFENLALMGLDVDSAVDLRLLRATVEPVFLSFERRWSGRAAALPGDCPYCRCGTECTRLSGSGCRHAEFIRPSLEALGINVVKLINNVFGHQVAWRSDRVFLVGGVFYNGDRSAELDQFSASVSSALGRLASVSRRRES